LDLNIKLVSDNKFSSGRQYNDQRRTQARQGGQYTQRQQRSPSPEATFKNSSYNQNNFFQESRPRRIFRDDNDVRTTNTPRFQFRPENERPIGMRGGKFSNGRFIANPGTNSHQQPNFPNNRPSFREINHINGGGQGQYPPKRFNNYQQQRGPGGPRQNYNGNNRDYRGEYRNNRGPQPINKQYQNQAPDVNVIDKENQSENIMEAQIQLTQ
jgi:hypothetical protein